ncbi:hypothetical protein [Anaerostipes sp. PC18]|uniref:hypothetical protein n=1 Tax=Anaerostipes sp. PC18 TaxID=3036926 RepID=UPI00321F8D86
MDLFSPGSILFYFFPVVIGYNSAGKFKLSPYLGMMIGAALCYPTQCFIRRFSGRIVTGNNGMTDIGLEVLTYTVRGLSLVIVTSWGQTKRLFRKITGRTQAAMML